MLANNEMPKGVTIINADTPEGLAEFEAAINSNPHTKVIANFDWCKDTVSMLSTYKEQTEAAAAEQPVIMLYTNKAQTNFNAIKASRELPQPYRDIGAIRNDGKTFFQCPSLVTYEDGKIANVVIAEAEQAEKLTAFFEGKQSAIDPSSSTRTGLRQATEIK